MKKKTLAVLLLSAALGLAATAALNAYRPAIDGKVLSFQNIQIVAFRGADGMSRSAGPYELRIQQGAQGILIGLLRNGKTVGEFPGKFAAGMGQPPDPIRAAGMGEPPEPSRAAGMGEPPDPGRAAGKALHFDSSSRIAFEQGGRTVKIFPSNQLHPGGANLGWIEFQLPAGQASGK